MKRFVLMLALSLLAAPVLADDVPEFTIVIKDHQFTPAELTIPAGVKVKLIIDNQDATPEEFESHELNREKIIPGNSQAKIFVGPLEAGVYPFFGEFNEATAQGKLIVK
jgi:plastocyanin